ncbi:MULTISPECIES: hypothetical protein [unclassified Nocardioides]|uniref:hypothetical protein n=1 Tax=unclassified Nocardioides TaxID=2615069 RepID=UPI0007037916|nr:MULTISPECIES: hypothetical protein [unclassified Nocardioides]KQZ76119.1 hypothetical protein ASD66_07545 [Nocardioides sp. Root151]KRF20289.1 hypothetical protein ASH02_21435 [Nocardioides sp. Soil796]
MRRIAFLCASAILLAGTTAACGDDDSSGDTRAGDPASPGESTSETTETPTDDVSETPTETESTETESTDPNTSEFCTAATAEGFDEGGFTEIKSWGAGLAEATPPSELSSDEAAGLQILIKMVNGAKTEAELTKAGNSFTPDEKAQVDAFLAYVNRECL